MGSTSDNVVAVHGFYTGRMDMKLELVADIDDMPWGRFIFFRDPDGNAWAVQQIPEGM